MISLFYVYLLLILCLVAIIILLLVCVSKRVCVSVFFRLKLVSVHWYVSHILKSFWHSISFFFLLLLLLPDIIRSYLIFGFQSFFSFPSFIFYCFVWIFKKFSLYCEKWKQGRFNFPWNSKGYFLFYFLLFSL